MPTEYTAPVCDGEVTDLPTFALRCARAFAPLIHMRDMGLNVEIPDVIEPSVYHRDDKLKAEERLAELERMDHAAKAAGAEADFLAHQEAIRQVEADRELTNGRIDAMIAQVEAWSPPTPDHAGLKEFMIDQLRISRSTPWEDEPVRVTPEEWWDEQVAKAKHDIAYHDKKWSEEVARAAERTVWVRALRGSLLAVGAHP